MCAKELLRRFVNKEAMTRDMVKTDETNFTIMQAMIFVLLTN
jgi:hypothetical protein